MPAVGMESEYAPNQRTRRLERLGLLGAGQRKWPYPHLCA